MTNEYDTLDDSSEIEYKPLDIDLMRKNIPTYSSEKLCEIIVCDRYFGCFREIAVICMEELANRRGAGNDFNFEEYIETAFKKLPELNLVGINLRDVLTQAIGRKSNK
jgi:hypothetical protein